jgi:phosphoribosylaminoimidazole-succinocarboxamide synthase
VVENSKECFRKLLQTHFPDPDILVNKDRMVERTALAVDNELPAEMLLEVSRVYVGLAEKITGMWVVPCDIILSGACTRMRTAACAVV